MLPKAPGPDPVTGIERLRPEDPDAIGGNCGNGPDELIGVVQRMQAAGPIVPLVAKSNAGMPELIDMRAVYRADPETMAGAALTMQDSGARIVGGCCGTTPAHLELIAATIRG